MIACPACGARNTDGAPWCTQCLRPLGQADEPPASLPAAAPSTDPVPSPAGEDRAVRSVAGRFEWRCPACESWNDLDQPMCAVCGQPLGATVTGAGREGVTERVGRARRLLWVAAGIGGVLMVVSVVLLVLALRSGAAG